jgi:hypothetical protein
MADGAECRTVEELAMRGLIYAQILSLGFPDRDDLRQAVERGQTQGTLNVATALYHKAVNGDLRACEIYLRARGGAHWTASLVDVAGGPPLTLAAMREMFAKEIEADD